MGITIRCGYLIIIQLDRFLTCKDSGQGETLPISMQRATASYMSNNKKSWATANDGFV